MSIKRIEAAIENNEGYWQELQEMDGRLRGT
jgi:hypothetical protein